MLEPHPPHHTPSAPHQPAALSRASSVWRLLGLLLSVYAMVSLIEFILWDSNHLPGAGTIGAEQAQFAPAPKVGPGFVTVNSVARSSPLDLAGIVAGDRLRFDPVFDYLRYRRSGEVFHAVVDRAGQRSAVTLISVPRTAPPHWQAVRFSLRKSNPRIFGASHFMEKPRPRHGAPAGWSTSRPSRQSSTSPRQALRRWSMPS